MAVSVKEQQKRRRMAVSSSRTPFDRDFLKFRFKVKPCSVEGCDQDGCSYLHPVEVGRRDPRRFFYDTKPCRDYYRNGGWCPKGDGCKHAHGFLERRFHPSRHWDDEEALEFADLEEHLKEEERLSRHAPERAAIQFILDVKNQIRFYPCDPNRMQQHEAIAPVTTQLSFYDTDDAGYQHDPGASIIDDLSDAFGSDLTLERNDRAICGAPFCQTQKVVPEHIYGIADTTVTKERAEILASIDASQTCGVATPAIRLVHLILDSGATTHAVGGQKHPEGLSNFVETQGRQTARWFDREVRRYRHHTDKAFQHHRSLPRRGACSKPDFCQPARNTVWPALLDCPREVPHQAV